MSTFWKVALAITAIILAIWHYYLNHSNADSKFIIKENGEQTPTFVGLNMYAIKFNEEGKKQYFAEVKKVEYFSNQGVTYFQDPKLWLFNYGQSDLDKDWLISSNLAILNKNHEITLKENVEIKNLVPNALVQGLKNQQITINIDTGDISSSFSTEIYGKGLSSTGKRLLGNLKQQKIILEDQVETNYAF